MSYLEGKRGGGGGGAREESREGVDDSGLLYALAGAGEHLWGVWFGRESGSRSVVGRMATLMVGGEVGERLRSR